MSIAISVSCILKAFVDMYYLSEFKGVIAKIMGFLFCRYFTPKINAKSSWCTATIPRSF